MKKIFSPLIFSLGILLSAQTSGPFTTANEHTETVDSRNAAMVLDFTIDQDAFVNQCISQVNVDNIANTIVTLENYGTRFHTKPSGVQASHDIKNWWQALVDDAGRTDISVEEFNHGFTNQVSVIVTIPGSVSPDEIVVIGGHLDCGDYWIQDFAPGADDNASGIATLTETLRILLANNFHPKKTVQIMGYAAEEIGLYGSADIAETYKNQSKNVLAVLQLDMTNYKGSSFDTAINNDGPYTSSELNLFLIDLLEHYNSSGDHIITYGFSKCNYACSDHASWTQNGFNASFTMESAFEDSNPNIHTTNDTFAAMGNDASHSAKFVKIALEFVIEIAKSSNLSTADLNAPKLQIAIDQRDLVYRFDNFNGQLDSVVIFGSDGQKIKSVEKPDNNGKISMKSVPAGAYVAIFKDSNGKNFSKKFLLK